MIKLLDPHRFQLVSAAFAFAHLVHSFETRASLDTISFPSHVLYSVHFYNIMATPVMSTVIPPQFRFFDIDHEQIQRIAAAAIARTAAQPDLLLRQVAGAISGKLPENIEPLELPPAKFRHVQVRGLLFLAEQLSSHPIPISEYLNAFNTLLGLPNVEKSLNFHSQLFLSELMLNCPAAFHALSILDLALTQARTGLLTGEFLSAILFTFGLFAIRRFVTPMLGGWIDTIDDGGYRFLEMVSPYAAFLETDLQLSLQRRLVERCARRRFDNKLFETTAMADADVLIPPRRSSWILTESSQKLGNSLNPPFAFQLSHLIASNR
jgi:hypothetical protein